MSPSQDKTLRSLTISEKEMLAEIAILLFEQERFTLAQASRFAQMNQLQFQHLLASRQISLHYDVAELRKDVKSLADRGWK